MESKKRYLLTDSCFFWDNTEKKRNKHWIEVVDLDTGEVKELQAGSVIRIVSERRK